MKQAVILTTIVGLLTVAAAQAQTYQTNLVQNLNIQLFGLKQGATTTNGNYIITSANTATLGTGDIINALGTATGNSFSRAATLAVVTPLPNGTPGVSVLDGTNSFDVSSFFELQSLSGSVDSSVVNTRTGRSSVSDYSIVQFVLRDGFGSLKIHFNVSGLAVQSSSNPVGLGDVDATVTGAGDRNGNLLILQGAIHIHGNTLEVVEVNEGNF